jgi:hypothetical protein
MAIRVRRALASATLASLGVFGSAVAGATTTTGQRTHGAPGRHGGGDDSRRFTVRQILSGGSLRHTFVPAGSTSSTSSMSEALSNPDDITRLGDNLYVGFQNGVGPQGQPSTDGNTDSTVVELTLSGAPVAQWDVTGKTDGVTADPEDGLIIATVNEDADSALYTIDPTAHPAADAVTRYAYNEPLPHAGGTDAISIYHGAILISASAPGTTGAAAPQANYPAVYSVTLDSATRIATVEPLFSDEASATVANVNSAQRGQTTTLALTDPDSNEVVPFDAPRFAGDFMLTSQGDQQQIFVDAAGEPNQNLAVLSLSQSVDDTAWATDPNGRLYSTDSTNDAVDVVTGPFRADAPLAVATPCGANSAPPTCPAPPSFTANYLASLNPWTGQVTAIDVDGAPYVPQGGLVFVPRFDD